MTQLGVGNIANEDPLDAENALPLIGCPDGAATCIVHLDVQVSRQ